MPELPDLEVFSSNLDKELAGRSLEKLEIFKGAKINTAAKELKKSLEGAALNSVYREGKELRFTFGNGNILGLHLMLRGKLSWMDEPGKVPKYALMQMLFKDAKPLVLTDYQANARINLNPERVDVPDALSAEADFKFWEEQLGSRAMIKNLLLDQHIVRGIGNAYADEILWDAGISPFSISNKIPKEKIKSLAKSVKDVLTEAQKQIREKEPGIIGGEVRDFLKIHNSRKKMSPTGKPIRSDTQRSRKTYYTDEQQLYK